jgi:hypothetical protein
MRNLLRIGSLLAFALLFSACSKGGELVLEPGARIVKSKGSPYVSVNQGGKALIVQQGQTPSTGVHGWVTIQSVSARNLSSGSGHQMILNKTAAYQ